jgi:hypothetical protein
MRVDNTGSSFPTSLKSGIAAQKPVTHRSSLVVRDGVDTKPTSTPRTPDAPVPPAAPNGTQSGVGDILAAAKDPSARTRLTELGTDVASVLAAPGSYNADGAITDTAKKQLSDDFAAYTGCFDGAPPKNGFVLLGVAALQDHVQDLAQYQRAVLVGIKTLNTIADTPAAPPPTVQVAPEPAPQPAPAPDPTASGFPMEAMKKLSELLDQPGADINVEPWLSQNGARSLGCMRDQPWLYKATLSQYRPEELQALGIKPGIWDQPPPPPDPVTGAPTGLGIGRQIP